MKDGYAQSEPDDFSGDDFSDLDEWLCEYVDGTIDPVARRAFEEYMRANPALAQHVQRLFQARNLLCTYGCRHQAPMGLQPRLHRRLAVECDGLPHPQASSLGSNLSVIATFSSLLAIIVLIGSLDVRPRPNAARLPASISMDRALRASNVRQPRDHRPAPSFAALSQMPIIRPLNTSNPTRGYLPTHTESRPPLDVASAQELATAP